MKKKSQTFVLYTFQKSIHEVEIFSKEKIWNQLLELITFHKA